MNKKSRFSFGAILLFLTLLLAACSTDTQKGTVELHASWPVAYEAIEDLASASDVVAVVKVLNVAGSYEITEDIPVTEFKVEVIESIYGVEDGDIFIVPQTGSISSDTIIEIADDPLMSAGEEYLIFGYYNELGTVTIIGGPQGRYNYNNGKVSYLGATNTMSRTSANASSIETYDWIASELCFVNIDISTLTTEVIDALER